MAGMPAVLVTGMQALCFLLTCLPIRHLSATRTGWCCSQAIEHGASAQQHQTNRTHPQRIRASRQSLRAISGAVWVQRGRGRAVQRRLLRSEPLPSDRTSGIYMFLRTEPWPLAMAEKARPDRICRFWLPLPVAGAVSSQLVCPGSRELSICVPPVASRVPLGHIPGPSKLC